MVPKALGVTSAKELDGATVCIQTGTTTELNLADFFRINNISYEPVPIETNAEAQQKYLAGACDAYTTDASGLAATRATFETPTDHVILPEIISKEPLGPAVRHGDDQWGDIVRWTLNALIIAEELGITQDNVEDLAKAPTDNPEINRLLGTEGEYGAMMGLPKDWAVQAIKAARQLWRDLRPPYRPGHPDRPRARAERAVDRGRHPLLAAVPLIQTGRARRARPSPSAFRAGRRVAAKEVR